LFTGRRGCDDNSTICSPSCRLGGKHRARSDGVWHPLLPAPDKGDADLPSHGEFASRSALARPH
jgi:hypothetical protein